MNSKGKYRIKCIISSILSFLICLLSFFLIFLVIAKITILNENFMVKTMNKSNFYYQVKNELAEQMAVYEGTSGFNNNFFNNAIDINMVEKDAKIIVHNIYSNNNEIIDVSEFKKVLYDKFMEEANTREDNITNETQKSLEYFAQTCAETYLNIIKVPFSNQVSLLINSFVKPVNIAILALSGSILFIALFMFLISKSNSVRYFIYALESEFLFAIIIPTVYFISGKINNIPIINQALRNFAIFYVNRILYHFIYIAIIILLLIIILLIIYGKTLKKVKKISSNQ